VATSIALPKPGGARPPFGGPPRTSFAPDPDGPDENYLVARHRRAVESLEAFAGQPDQEPSALLAWIEAERTAIEESLRRERTVYPTVLPPGIGTLYYADEVLLPETQTVSAYLYLLDRLERLTPSLKAEANFRRLVGD